MQKKLSPEKVRVYSIKEANRKSKILKIVKENI
jgi:hypothetical protein